MKTLQPVPDVGGVVEKRRTKLTSTLVNLALAALVVHFSDSNARADTSHLQSICAKANGTDLESLASSIAGPPNVESLNKKPSPKSISSRMQGVRKWSAPPSLKIFKIHGPTVDRTSKIQDSKKLGELVQRKLEEIFVVAISAIAATRVESGYVGNYMTIVSYIPESLSEATVWGWDYEEVINIGTMHQRCSIHLRLMEDGTIVGADNFIFEMTDQQYLMQIAENPSAALNMAKLSDVEIKKLISQVRTKNEEECASSSVPYSIGVRVNSPYDNEMGIAFCAAALLYQFKGKGFLKKSTHTDVIDALKAQFRKE